MCFLTKSGGQHTPGLWTRQIKWMNAKTLPVLHLGLPLPGKSVLPVPSPVPQQAFPWPPALPSAALCPQHCCDLRTGCWGCFWAKSCQHHLLSALVPLDPSAHLARDVLLNSLSKAGKGCQKCLLRVALILKCHKPQAACNEWQTCHWFWVVENKRQCLGRVWAKEWDPCEPTLGCVGQSVPGAGAVLLTSLAKGAAGWNGGFCCL